MGQSVDSVLTRVEPLFDKAAEAEPGTSQREAILAALNGVMGDRLVADDNPLATPMTFYYRGEALDPQSLPQRLEVPSSQTSRPKAVGSTSLGKVVLLIHGLCMNDQQWHTESEGIVVDHGATLATELAYTPIYLRYNSGLHVSQSGHELATRMEQLLAAWPETIEELTVVAHSLGGLLARSAVHYAIQDGLRWPSHLKNLVFLGTPHHGAPLERAGNWVDVILRSTPYSAPFARLGRLRSAGITDLRYGHLVDEDWKGRDRFERNPDGRRFVPLPENVACYAIAATRAARRSILADRLVGDGLVPLHSALGRHRERARSLHFEEDSRWIGYRMRHMQLLSSHHVTRQMLRWLAPAAQGDYGS